MTSTPSAAQPAEKPAVTLTLEQVSTLLAAKSGSLITLDNLLPAFKASAAGQDNKVLAKHAALIIGNFFMPQDNNSNIGIDTATIGIENLFAAMLEIGGADLVGSTYVAMRGSVDARLRAIWAGQYFANLTNGQGQDGKRITQNMFYDLINAKDFSNLQIAALDALTRRDTNWHNYDDFLNPIKLALCAGSDSSRRQLVCYLLEKRDPHIDLHQILDEKTADPFMRAVLEGEFFPPLLFEHPKALEASRIWLPELVKQTDPEALPGLLNDARRKGAINIHGAEAALKTFITIAPAFNPKPWHYRTLDCLLGMTDPDSCGPVLYNPEKGHTDLARKPWIAQSLRQRGMLRGVSEKIPHVVSYAKPVAIMVLSAVLGAAAVFGGQWLSSLAKPTAPAPSKQVGSGNPQTDVSILLSRCVPQQERA
jgi:hypothetical protein